MSKSDKTPAYQWYPRDFLADVLALNDTEELLYRRLLDYQWLHGAVPKALTMVARAGRMTLPKVKAAWPAVGPYFPVSSPDGGWQNRRLERVRAEQEAFRARQRENGLNGGRPPKLKLEGAA